MNKMAWYASSAVCLVLAYSPAIAADNYDMGNDACSVSAINGKISGAAGAYSDINSSSSEFHGAASLTVPLHCMLGAQIDIAGGTLDGVASFGLATHLFTRDPNQYLLGIYVEGSTVGSNNYWRVGAEAEYYLDQITLSGLLGYEYSNVGGADAFAVLDLSYYPTEDMRLSAGYRRFLGVDALAVGVEYQFEDMPVSMYATGQLGTQNHARGMVGFRLYLGDEDKSLIERHREDDPFAVISALTRNVTPAPVEKEVCTFECVDD